MRRFAFVSLLFLLTGCPFEERKPNPSPAAVSKAKIQGRVILKDIRGNAEQAYIAAGFVPQSESRTTASGDYGRVQCALSTKKASGGRAREGFLSVGKMGFGPALQTTLLALTEDVNHVYSRELDPGFPTGEYIVYAEGTKETGPVKALLSLPEELADVRVNGTLPSSTPIKLSKKNSIRLEWRAPLAPHDNNVLRIGISVTVENLKTTFECAAREMAMQRDGNFLSWVLPEDKIYGVPASEGAEVYVMREHISINDSPQIDLHGIRYSSGTATLEE